MTDRTHDILVTAAECFMERGFHATSVDDVARRLGSTKGRVYHHYASKTDLFFAVHREGMARLFAAVEPALAGPGDGLSVLRAMLRAHALALFENHTFESVVVQGVNLHRFGAMTPTQRGVLDGLIAGRDSFEALFKRAMLRAVADGSAAERDASLAVKAMLGALQWSLIWYRPELDSGPRAREALADGLVDTLVQGLRTRA